jgi:hypothetical protein
MRSSLARYTDEPAQPALLEVLVEDLAGLVEMLFDSVGV